MGKRALVLAGGGSRGSYQIGVWRALRELGWNFQIVTGTSVGALNGALIVQDDYDLGLQMWGSISTSDVLSMQIDEKMDSLRDVGSKLGMFLSEMTKNGGADPRPLENILRQYVDEDRIRNSSVDFAIVTVAYPSLEPRIITKENLPEGELVDYLMASAACFPAMKMRQIGEERFIDGGYHDNLPVSLAVERGAEEIVAVDLEAVGRKKRVVADGVKIRYIRSKWGLGVFMLFDKEVAQRNIRLGYLDTIKAFGGLEGGAYTFYKGETLKNARALEKYFDLVTVKTSLAVQKYTRNTQEPNANVRLARITKRTIPQMKSQEAIVAAAETAARVFELSPVETYRFDELNGQLLAESAKIAESDHAVLAGMVERLKPKELLEAIKLLDWRHVAMFCMSEIRKTYSGEDRSTIIKVLARLTPDALVAGLYLFVLELAGRLSAELPEKPGKLETNEQNTPHGALSQTLQEESGSP